MLSFRTVAISGKGRGKNLGFPTINMQIPAEVPLALPEGIYAGTVTINKQSYGGALFYGSIPVFGENEKSLEVYLVDSGYISVNPSDELEVAVKKFIRPVQNFSSPELMILQMEKDVHAVRLALGLV
jgi:riboflavin kinase/FMN adenylyltransferase